MVHLILGNPHVGVVYRLRAPGASGFSVQRVGFEGFRAQGVTLNPQSTVRSLEFGKVAGQYVWAVHSSSYNLQSR